MPPLPQMTSVALRLPAGGPVVGMVVITAVAVPGPDRAQFTVSAVITGGRPGTAYDLTGNDCSDAAPLPDHVWATGLAGADGTAEPACSPLDRSGGGPVLAGSGPVTGQPSAGPARAVRAGKGGAFPGWPGTVALLRRDTLARRSRAGPHGLPTARAFPGRNEPKF